MLSKNNENIGKLNNFPSPNKDIFYNFIEKINDLGWYVIITSAYRTSAEQERLKNKDERNASAETSAHRFYRAIDINVFQINQNNSRINQLYKNSSTKKWEDTGIIELAKELGLKWGGYFNGYPDRVHFEIPGVGSEFSEQYLNQNNNLKENYKKEEGYHQTIRYDYVTETWKTLTGETVIDEKIIEQELKKRETYVTIISDTQEKNAVGIWQIIKMVSDQYSLSQHINDATISTNQGSLLNFVQKVVQPPWLQFWGDTIGDQYYFHCRKEPFDYDGMTKLPLIKIIEENEIEDVDLSWYDGDIYSWYQIIPRGSFTGEQNLIFAYVKAVFFEEYAEIWGSKPNIQVSNYVNFVKIDEESKMFKKAIADLKYMVESNAYLPFTRQGIMTISGDNSIRRGYRIYNKSTGEIFYVDSVQHSYVTGENGPDFKTTLMLSRGMIVKDYQKYFNIINFNESVENTTSYDKEIEDKGIELYFDNGRSYIINLSEDFDTGNATDNKMLKQIEQYPALRTSLYLSNSINISRIVDYIQKYKENEFIITGEADGDNYIQFSYLPLERAKKTKELIIREYIRKYNDISEKELDKKITLNQIQNKNDDNDLMQKAYDRKIIFQLVPFTKKEEKEQEKQTIINWKVDRDIFNYFLNRKQFITDER